jgi:glutathione S-transferase
MAITLYHHPFSRASGTVWTLEEIGEPYELKFVDILKGGTKAPDLVAINPMGKIPVLRDGDVVVTENAAIALYLADRYAPGKLAPRLDDPRRGTYLRWTLFSPSVVEPAALAKLEKWEYKSSQAGWGDYAAVLATIEHALTGRTFLLGDTFSIADVVFGGTLRFMLERKLIEPRPLFTAYAERLGERPALKRANERNAAVLAEHGIKFPT